MEQTEKWERERLKGIETIGKKKREENTGMRMEEYERWEMGTLIKSD